MQFKIGYGCDTHRMVEGRKLILGGVEIPFEKGLLGHSDADALTHAVIDALLGAAAMGDIGAHFPDTNPQYKGADSIELLKQTKALLKDYQIGNIDAVIIIQKPKMLPHVPKMRETLAEALGISVDCVSVKAKTAEGMGDIGRSELVETRCVALLYQA
ncbi:MAG: 2-C-methyl-D-erythritol 2,4-cyclodiphosphate synthase [Clostridia bacterium]|nr:2-C-methyl-D-erythritol 2,4-cyclodiphosphate synthase [Clostridia bacterium]